MKDLARVGAVGGELGARGLDVVDDEERSLNRTRRGAREALPDEDGARRARGRQLDHSPVALGKIGVDPPPEALVETLGAIDVGHGDGDDLELRLDPAHRDLRVWGVPRTGG